MVFWNLTSACISAGALLTFLLDPEVSNSPSLVLKVNCDSSATLSFLILCRAGLSWRVSLGAAFAKPQQAGADSLPALTCAWRSAALLPGWPPERYRVTLCVAASAWKSGQKVLGQWDADRAVLDLCMTGPLGIQVFGEGGSTCSWYLQLGSIGKRDAVPYREGTAACLT